MIALFPANLRRLFSCPEGAGPHTSWSTRVPCPGGRAARTVGCGRRVPSAAPPFCTSWVSGALASGALIGAGAGTAATFIGNILFVVFRQWLHGDEGFMNPEPSTARHRRQSRQMVNESTQFH